MRDSFIRSLLELAKEDRSIELITGDLGFGVLKPFWEAVPDQFINVGIAEQNMTSIAAGMALESKTVFTYSIGNFPTLRCLEQIRNDCAYHGANVKIVCIGGGYVYGSLGMRHHATEDLAVMRSLPDVAVFAPADKVEAAEVARAVAKHPGTCYIRLGRGGEAVIRESIDNFRIGKAIPVCTGSRVAIFSTGVIYGEVAAAREVLEHAASSPPSTPSPPSSPWTKRPFSAVPRPTSSLSPARSTTSAAVSALQWRKCWRRQSPPPDCSVWASPTPIAPPWATRATCAASTA